jgi:hypothetical protein
LPRTRRQSSPTKGELLWAAGHREQALQLLKQLEAAEPDFISPHLYLRFAYFETGSYPNYIVELKTNALLTHDAAQSSVAEAAANGFAKGARGAQVPGHLRPVA